MENRTTKKSIFGVVIPNTQPKIKVLQKESTVVKPKGALAGHASVFHKLFLKVKDKKIKVKQEEISTVVEAKGGAAAN